MDESQAGRQHEPHASPMHLFAEGSAVERWSVSRALLIREPWASMILSGTKRWEIRSTSTSIRGPIAIAAGGTGTIVGVCNVVGVRGPLSVDDYAQSWKLRGEDRPGSRLLPYARTYAWVLSDLQALRSRVPYRHPSGAVIWVKLPPDVQEALRESLERNAGYPRSAG